MTGEDGDETLDEMAHRVGVLFAAAVAGWATVASVIGLVWLLQAVSSGAFAGIWFLIPMTLLVALGSFLAAIPICMAMGLPALAVTRLLQLQKWWQWAIVGVCVGVAIVYGLASIPTPIAPLIVAPVAGLFAIAGAVAGTVAWRRHQIDRPPA